MEKPAYVLNDIKYQRALENAKNPQDEAEVKALYVSYGGAMPLSELSTNEIKMEEKETNVPHPIVDESIETPEYVAPIEEIETVEIEEETPVEVSTDDSGI